MREFTDRFLDYKGMMRLARAAQPQPLGMAVELAPTALPAPGISFSVEQHDISERIEHLKRRVVEAGFPYGHAIHCAPLIRREEDYGL